MKKTDKETEEYWPEGYETKFYLVKATRKRLPLVEGWMRVPETPEEIRAGMSMLYNPVMGSKL